MDDFPGNSRREREEKTLPPKQSAETKKVDRVTTNDVVRRKPSLGKRFRNTFMGGDARGVWGYVVMDVLVPAAKDTITEAVTQGVERMVFGEARRNRGYRGDRNLGHIRYNNMGSSSSRAPWQRDEPRRDVSRRARANHNFDEIVLETRGEAEEVIDRLFDMVAKYDVATVSDLYDLTGITGDYTDRSWGWTDMRGARAEQVRGGYLLNLPRPEPLT